MGEEMIEGENKRNTPRMTPQDIDGVWQLNINHDELITRNIINLSPTGLSFKAPVRTQFYEGQVLHLTLNMSPLSPELGSFDLEGKVVWTKGQQFGLRFLKIPQIFDSFVMKAIHGRNLEIRRLELEKEGKFNAGLLRKDLRLRERDSILSSAFNLVLIALMSVALITVIFMHQKNNPQYSLSYIVEQAFQKRLAGPGK